MVRPVPATREVDSLREQVVGLRQYITGLRHTLLAIHVPFPGGQGKRLCRECGMAWPCVTVEVVGGEPS